MAERAAAVEASVEKCLTFRLAAEVFGIAILRVQEIIGMMHVTRVPRMPAYVRGVVNLRGRIIPVIDLRRRFGVGSAEDTEVTCIIVVQVEAASGPLTVGLIVDEVREVVDIPTEQIEPVPALGSDIESSLISGMGKLEQQVVMLLDIDQVLTAGELDELGQVSAEESDAEAAVKKTGR